MKKLVAILIIVVGVILGIWGVNAKVKEAAAIGIIGGADGPTSIFIAGRMGNGVILGAILVAIILVVVGAIIYRNIKKK